VNHQVAVIGEDPLRLVEPFHAVRQFPRLPFDLQPDILGDRLNLLRIVARADDESVGEGSNRGQVQDLDVCGFLRFRGANSD
jgi:hypothetical protein